MSECVCVSVSLCESPCVCEQKETKTHKISQISASSMVSAKLPPITERGKPSFAGDDTHSTGSDFEGAGNDGDSVRSRPTPRSSISWTPGVNEASAKRIRERVLLSLDQERKQSRSLSLGMLGSVESIILIDSIVSSV